MKSSPAACLKISLEVELVPPLDITKKSGTQRILHKVFTDVALDVKLLHQFSTRVISIDLLGGKTACCHPHKDHPTEIPSRFVVRGHIPCISPVFLAALEVANWIRDEKGYKHYKLTSTEA